MHIADFSVGMLGANGIVAAGIPIATGAGWTCQYQKKGKVSVVFFGDGAANEGAFHEGLNLAAVWKLPVIYVCENNQYAMSYATRKAFAIQRISDRAAAYGMPGVTVDGNDVLAVYEAVSAAVQRARNGEGPSLVENFTYRWRGHSKSDANVYRTREEIESWKKKCPIKRFRALLIKEGALTEERAEQIEKQSYDAIESATAFAESSPEPALESIMEGVYA